MITEQRSSVDNSNIQEILDAENNKGSSAGKQEQYETPLWLAKECWDRLPSQSPASCLDPQAFQGALLHKGTGWTACANFAIELDNRVENVPYSKLITANCMKVFDIIEDIHPNLRFVCVNANPPYGRRWKKSDGTWIDSTQATWDFAVKHGNFGFFISNKVTIEKLGLHKSPLVYSYTSRKMSEVWRDMRDGEIGILHWKHFDQSQFTHSGDLARAWQDITKIVEDEKSLKPKWNIFLDHSGILKTYLSIRSGLKLKVSFDDVQKLHRINDCHPLTLTTEKETRVLMKSLVDCGVYQIEPAAKKAIQDALDEVNALACPIMPTTSFQDIAYLDEEDVMVCSKSCTEIDGRPLRLTAGKSYPINTATYKFSEAFKRNKVHYNMETKETFVREHECVLSGCDRYIEIKDDNLSIIRFMDRPRKNYSNEFEEKLVWKHFEKPDVRTVAETCKASVDQNLAVLKAVETIAGFKYLPGQETYMARMGVKDSGLIAAEGGTGKTLMAITLMSMKSPRRTLIVAPQGTVRSSEDEDGEDEMEYTASQWCKEIARFAPHLEVHEIFSYDDYRILCATNGGQLPDGVFITYYAALLQNGAMEKVPDSWDDIKFNQWAKANSYSELPVTKNENGELLYKRFNCDSVGQENNGIRCIIKPCLATEIGDQFDCVMLDEAHVMCNLSALNTQMLIRLQPKYRYALTATPIPNVITNIFSLMGWIAVPGWFRGARLNAAFPYAREDVARFNNTFLTTERDLTQEETNRRKDPKWRGACVKESPIISSPARLLKILNPTMGFISKAQCNVNYIPPDVIDARVNMGKEQSVLYTHFLNKANIQGNNPLIIARKQTAWLRNICADPKGFTHGGPKVLSNLNPKILSILELTHDILAKGEQVVIINARVGLTDTIHEKLIECGVKCARIDSTMPAAEHSGQANLFKTGRRQAMLLGLKCAAAYSFDDCPNEIIASIEFSPGVLNQAKWRVDRVTNKVKKKIYIILHKNSMEELQYDLVACKDDASTICLRGERVPREFRPQDPSELMAKAIERADFSGATPESQCENDWPKLRERIKKIVAASHTRNSLTHNHRRLL